LGIHGSPEARTDAGVLGLWMTFLLNKEGLVAYLAF
jgi:hypothetical protein